MPMETIDAHLITQFSDMMHLKAQQSKSRLRPYCVIKRMSGDVYAYDGLGTVEAREVMQRYAPTQFDDIEHFRRKLPKRRFVVTLPMDRYDLEGKLTDPQGDYALAVTKAMERMFDRVVYDALFADVQTGRDFSTTVTAATDGVLTVNATGGLTLAKLLEIKQNFMDSEIGNEDGVRVCVGISGDEHTTLQQISQLTSGDFTRQFALERGVMVSALGMDLIPFGAGSTIALPLLAVSGGVRTCFAISVGGVCVGIAREWEITIKDRPDLVDTKQLQITGVIGAVRTEGRRVQKLTTTDL